MSKDAFFAVYGDELRKKLGAETATETCMGRQPAVAVSRPPCKRMVWHSVQLDTGSVSAPRHPGPHSHTAQHRPAAGAGTGCCAGVRLCKGRQAIVGDACSSQGTRDLQEASLQRSVSQAWLPGRCHGACTHRTRGVSRHVAWPTAAYATCAPATACTTRRASRGSGTSASSCRGPRGSVTWAAASSRQHGQPAHQAASR